MSLYRYARAAGGAVRRGRNKWTLTPFDAAVGAATAAKYVYNQYGTPPKRSAPYQRITPSKRPAMKNRIPTRSGKKAMRKMGAQNYGRNMGGRYYKRFGRARSSRFDKSFNKHGVVYKQENGSTESCPISNSVYVGHGVAPQVLYRNIMRALVKKLFGLKGIYIENFDDIVSEFIFRAGGTETAYRIAYFWRNSTDESAAVSSAQYGFTISTASTETWNDLVNGLITHIAGNLPDVYVNYGEIHFHRFLLQTATGTDVSTDSVLDCEYLKFDIIVTSHLSLQNRTNDAAGSTNILSTTNNPIIGKQYDSTKQWLNGFDLSKTQSGPQPAFFDALYTNGGVGIIATNSSDTFPRILQKPPQAWQLGVNKQASVMMQPGAVRDHRIKWKCSIGFNAIIQKLEKYVATTASLVPRRVELGFCTLFGLECMLNDRSETTELQVGWELNQTYMVKCYAGKPPTVPMIVVQ